MSEFNIEKGMASAFCLAAVLTFSAVVDVQAETVFPPRHLSTQASFGEAAAQAGPDFRGPWYFDGTGNRADALRIEFEDVVRGARISSAPDVTPWYHAAN